MRNHHPCWLLLLLLLVPTPSFSSDPGSAEANLGKSGGTVQLPDGITAALLPGSAALEPGWHRLRLETTDAQLPRPEAVGTRPIDRRATGPLGQVEGPPVPIGPGLRLRLVDPDPSQEVATGAIDPDAWPGWLASVPVDLMPFLPPEQAAVRQGYLLVIPSAAPPGGKERLSTWLFSPGGMHRRADARPGDDGMEAWDPCLRLGRMDGEGAAWFFLADTACGPHEVATWTPLREQSQREFADQVLAESPPEQHKELKRELKAMARDEAKRERE